MNTAISIGSLTIALLGVVLYLGAGLKTIPNKRRGNLGLTLMLLGIVIGVATNVL